MSRRTSKKDLEAALILAPVVAVFAVIAGLTKLIETNPFEGIPLAVIAVALVGLGAYVFIHILAQRDRALRAMGLAGIDRMSGHDFEKYMIRVFANIMVIACGIWENRAIRART